MLSTTQLHYEILSFIDQKRKIETLQEIIDHLCLWEISQKEVEKVLVDLKKAGRINGLHIFMNGIEIIGSISLNDRGVQRLEELRQQNNVVVNGNVYGNVGANNGTIHIQNNSEIEKLFERLFAEMKNANVNNYEQLIQEINEARNKKDNKSVVNTLAKIISFGGDFGSITQTGIALLPFFTS